MKLFFYRMTLKWLLKNKDRCALTGKQKSQIENLLKKMEV